MGSFMAVGALNEIELPWARSNTWYHQAWPLLLAHTMDAHTQPGWGVMPLTSPPGTDPTTRYQLLLGEE